MRAWRAGGEQWKAWSSRLGTATVQAGKANRTDKNNVLDDLQQALDAVPPSECYVFMGDFNARVGSSTSVDDQWAVVLGWKRQMKLDENCYPS